MWWLMLVTTWQDLDPLGDIFQEHLWGISFSFWACLWEAMLIGLIEVGKPTLKFGEQCFLGLGVGLHRKEKAGWSHAFLSLISYCAMWPAAPSAGWLFAVMYCDPQTVNWSKSFLPQSTFVRVCILLELQERQLRHPRCYHGKCLTDSPTNSPLGWLFFSPEHEDTEHVAKMLTSVPAAFLSGQNFWSERPTGSQTFSFPRMTISPFS